MAARGGENIMSDEIVINKCSICAKKKTKTEATTYCADCKDYYCASCVNIHTVVPAMEHHKLLDKSDFTSSRSGAGSLPSFPTQRCDEHKSEVLNMYCQNHDEVACAMCIDLNHRFCKDLFSIPENIYNLCKRSEMSNVEHRIELTRTKIEETKKSKEAHKQLLTKSLDTALDSVKTFKQELQTLLDEIENETILELNKQFERIEKSLADEIKIAEIQIDALNRMSTQLRTMEGNNVREFVCVKTFEKLAKTCEIEMNKQQRQPDEIVSFAADQSVRYFLQKRKVYEKVTCQLPSISETRLTVTPQSITPTTTLSKNILYKVIKQREIDIRLPDEHRHFYCIWGTCITDGGFLLLADFRNMKLKRLNLTTEKVTDYLHLISRPYAVCQVSKTEAAVSLDNKTVQFVTLGDKLTATRCLALNHSCVGLAHRNDKLFISNGDKLVFIHDMNGKELMRIKTDAYGNDIFVETKHIAIAPDGDRVFVADLYKGLITLDIQGNYLSTLRETEFQTFGCWGVCTDYTSMFLCGFNTFNVVQIGQDHKLLGQIAIFDMSCPMSVCFDPQKRRLYVARGGSDVISVLELV